MFLLYHLAPRVDIARQPRKKFSNPTTPNTSKYSHLAPRCY
jgi:hypothetical protein